MFYSNVSLFSFLRRLTTSTLLAFAAKRRAAGRRASVAADGCAIDRYLLSAGPTATNPHAVVDRWDRQTDGRLPCRFIDHVTYYASSVKCQFVSVIVY